jgi:hypothetical protein
MNRPLAAVIVALMVAAAAAAGFLIFRNPGPRGSVTVMLRLEVSPAAQAGFVAAQAESARFKYESGRKAGVKPVLAQKLQVKPLPNTAQVEMELRVENKEQGGRYADSFVEVLQAQCGDEARLKLVGRSVR